VSELAVWNTRPMTLVLFPQAEDTNFTDLPKKSHSNDVINNVYPANTEFRPRPLFLCLIPTLSLSLSLSPPPCFFLSFVLYSRFSLIPTFRKPFSFLLSVFLFFVTHGFLLYWQDICHAQFSEYLSGKSDSVKVREFFSAAVWNSTRRI
jgi:hypothetical protein